MRGCVTDSEGRPIANALVEVWQTAPNQLYDVQDEDQPGGHLRGVFAPMALAPSDSEPSCL
jgi:protocatechuate 3,4-dioxygenase beta subunit